MSRPSQGPVVPSRDTPPLGIQSVASVQDVLARDNAVEMLVMGELVGCTFADFPNIRAWIARMKALPHWAEVHAAYEGFKASLAGKEFVAI